MDINNAAHYEALRKAIKTSRNNLRPFRDKRKELITEYVGSQWGDYGAKREIPINLMAQAADTYVQMLSSNRPRVLVTPRYPDDSLRFFARHYQQSVNNLLKEIKIEKTLREVVLDAFFVMGIVKVYSADGNVQRFEDNEEIDVGRPYAERVSLDDWVHDTSASSWRKKRYCGNRYRVSWAKLKEDKTLDQSVVQHLTPEKPHEFDNDEKVSQMMRSETDGDELEEYVELWDIYIPSTHQLITMHLDSAKPLKVLDWTGGENGPYHILKFADVPDNVLGVSPAMQLRPLSRTINNLHRKLRAQAERQRKINIYSPSAMSTAVNMKNANDGDWVKSQDPQGVAQIPMGGIDQSNQAFEMWNIELFDRMGGNLQAMAGLGPQAETLGQDQLIAAGVSKREASMRQNYIDFFVGIAQDLGWMMWNDEFLEIPGEMDVAGITKIESNWTPELREGDWLQYNFDVDPHSIPYRSPSERLQGIMNFMQNVALPAMPLLQEQGLMVDFNELLDVTSELMDLPRLKHIVKGNPAPFAPQPVGQEPQQSQNTTRTYQRRSVPTGGTNESRSHVMQQALMGQQPNPDQMAAMSRPPASA